MIFLVTGAAGFIGSHVVHRLLDRGDEVVGLDNLNDYYDPKLKAARLARLTSRQGFTFVKADIADRASMEALFAKHRFLRVIHLAAQAGVRYSISHPHAYVEANIIGFQNILEGCRHNGCEHLTYASTSSVYGANTTMPFVLPSIRRRTRPHLRLAARTSVAPVAPAKRARICSPAACAPICTPPVRIEGDASSMRTDVPFP